MLKRLRGWYLACLVAALALYAGGLALNVSADEATLGSGFVNWVQGLPSITGGTGGSGGNNGGTTGGGGGNNGTGNGGATNNGGTGNGDTTSNGTTTGTGGGTTTGVRGSGGPTGKSANTDSSAPEDLIDEDHGIRYGLMDAASRAHYDDMLPHLRDREASFRVSGMSWDEIGTVFNAIRLDHPELFWLYTYSGLDYGGEFEITPKGSVPDDQIEGIQDQLEQVTADILAQVPADAGDYEKVKFCYEWIVNNTDYVHTEHDQTIQGVLIEHQAVCGGYSQAMQYLTRRLGVRCGYVSGKVVDGELHAWNLLWVDDTPTYVDVTWGDPVNRSEDGTVTPGDTLSYDYLCITTKEMDREHIAWDPEKPQLPICKAPKLDYYHRGGLFMKTFDKDALTALIQAAADRGETSVRFKVGSKKQHKAALDFVQSSDLYSCFPFSVSSVTLGQGGEIYTVEVSWEY